MEAQLPDSGSIPEIWEEVMIDTFDPASETLPGFAWVGRDGCLPGRHRAY